VSFVKKYKGFIVFIVIFPPIFCHDSLEWWIKEWTSIIQQPYLQGFLIFR